MLKALTHGIVLLAGAALLCGCPQDGGNGNGDDDSGIIYGGKQPSPRDVTLELKLAPGDDLEVVTTRAVAYTQLTGEYGAEGEPPAMSSSRTVTATEMLRRNIACSGGDGQLTLTGRFESFNSDELSKDNEGEARRVLAMDGGLKLTLNEEDAAPNESDRALAAALRREFGWLADRRSRYERSGGAWAQLQQARTSPFFPYIDWERLTEQAMLLPEGETSAGAVEDLTAELPVGDGVIPVRLNWMLREVVGAEGAELAQITVQVNGMLEEPATYRTAEGGVGYDGTVEHATVAGSYSMVFDAAAGRWRSIDSDLTANLTLRVAKGGGEPQTLAAELKNIHMRTTHEFIYEGEEAEDAAEDAPPEDAPAGEQ